MKKFLYIKLIVLISFSAANAQLVDPSLSLFGLQSSYLNPALTGQFNHKWQWNNTIKDSYGTFGSSYTTTISTLEIRLPINAWNGNIWAFGLRFFNDSQGDGALRHTRANGMFSIGQYLDARKNHSISVGFEGSYGMRSLSYDNLYWQTQWRGTGFDIDVNGSGDPLEPLIEDTKGYVDLNTGIQYTYRGEGLVDARAGFAIHHITRPDASLYLDGNLYNFDRRFVIHGDMEYRVNDHSLFYLRPSFYFSTQSKLNTAVFGNDFVFMFNEPTRTTGKRKEYSMSLGLFARASRTTNVVHDVIPTLKLNLAGFTFAAGYDFVVGNQRNFVGYTDGGMEFFIGYKAGFNKGLVNTYQRYKTGL